MIPPARTAAVLGLLVLAAFGVRMVALARVAPEVPALGDAHAYHVLAENLAEGRGYIRPYEWEQDGRRIETAEYPPGLPVLLAVATTAGARTETSQRVVLGAVGALTVGLTGLIGFRLGGSTVAVLAAAVAAVHPGLWNADVSLMAEPLAAAAGAAVVLAALAAVDRPSPPRWVALGVVGGLACLVRSEFLLITPALVAVAAWRTGTSGADRARRMAWGLGAVALVLAPWVVRNLVVFDGEPVLLSNNAGSVASGANCDAAYRGPYKGLWVTDLGDLGQSDPARAGCFSGFDLAAEGGRNEAEAAARSRAEGMAYLRRHLTDLPGVVVARVGRTVGVYQFTQQRNFAFAEGRNPTWDGRGTRTFQVLAVLAVAGLVASSIGRTRSWERWLLVIPPLAVVVVAAATYGNPRFRASAEPAAVVLAALGAVDLVALVRSRMAGVRGLGAGTPAP